MITKSELLNSVEKSERDIKLEKVFSLMLHRYLPKHGVICIRDGLGSKEICEDGELVYRSKERNSMQFQRHELIRLTRQAKENGFTVEYLVNSHNVGFWHISI